MGSSTVSAQTLAVSERVTLAGRLKPSSTAALAARNTMVIDLRGAAEEGRSDDEKRLRDSNVRYHNIPISGAVVTEKEVAALQDLLSNDPSSPVVLNCASGNRAALLWAALQITQGVDRAKAIDQVTAIINSEAVVPAINSFPSVAIAR
ncbi:MAG: hypothetical protein ACR2PZ_17745 [Pseudomonadales bacterium]